MANDKFFVVILTDAESGEHSVDCVFETLEEAKKHLKDAENSGSKGWIETTGE